MGDYFGANSGDSHEFSCAEASSSDYTDGGCTEIDGTAYEINPAGLACGKFSLTNFLIAALKTN